VLSQAATRFVQAVRLAEQEARGWDGAGAIDYLNGLRAAEQISRLLKSVDLASWKKRAELVTISPSEPGHLRSA
jgi:hypothetical protein